MFIQLIENKEQGKVHRNLISARSQSKAYFYCSLKFDHPSQIIKISFNASDFFSPLFLTDRQCT